MNPIVSSLLSLLDQGQQVLGVLEDVDYTFREPMAMEASIGGHMRHVLEHIEPVLDVPAGGVLDYDARPRDRRVETSLETARERIGRLQAALRDTPAGWARDGLSLRNRVATAEESVAVAASSRGRELMYSVAHTVHHYALIRVMCALRGIEVPEGFGFAPSTLHHLNTVSGG